MIKVTVTFIIAFLLGLGGHMVYLEIQTPAVTLSAEQENTFLNRYRCTGPVLSEFESKLLRQTFQARGNDEGQVKIEPLQNGCTFTYSVGADSYLLGKGAILRDENSKIKRIDFLSRLDPGVAEYDRPTFSLIFYGKNLPEFV